MVEGLRLGGGLRERTLAELACCGAGSAECVVYWTGPLARPGLVDEALHPEHRASPHGYEISAAWLDRVWRRLAREQRAIRAQVHTHPRDAFHSFTDDDYPIVHMPGFLSLVLPRFGEEPQTLADAHLARLSVDGRWEAIDARATLVGWR